MIYPRGRGNQVDHSLGNPTSGFMTLCLLHLRYHSQVSQCWESNKIKANAHCFTVVLAITKYWHTKFLACEVCIIWRKPTEAFKIHWQIAESRIRKPAMVTLKIQLDCFTVHDMKPLGEHICVQPFRMWNRPIFIHFRRFHKYFKDAKAMQINKILKWS